MSRNAEIKVWMALQSEKHTKEYPPPKEVTVVIMNFIQMYKALVDAMKLYGCLAVEWGIISGRGDEKIEADLDNCPLVPSPVIGKKFPF